MGPDPYNLLLEELAGAGLTGKRNFADQLIVSAQPGPVWPDRGNSFWLSHKEGIWYLTTWTPMHYRVPANLDMVQLCSACVAASTSAMDPVPPELVTRFGLQEIDERQYEELFPTEGEGD